MKFKKGKNDYILRKHPAKDAAKIFYLSAETRLFV